MYESGHFLRHDEDVKVQNTDGRRILCRCGADYVIAAAIVGSKQDQFSHNPHNISKMSPGCVQNDIIINYVHVLIDNGANVVWADLYPCPNTFVYLHE